jgi:putative ABC transport system permease protein
VLLAVAVALSTALIAAVACAIASVNKAVDVQLARQLGTAEVRVRAGGSGASIPAGVLDAVRALPGVAGTDPIVQRPVSIAFETRLARRAESGSTIVEQSTLRASAVVTGAQASSPRVRDLRLIVGRLPDRDDEVVIDALLAERLSGAWAGAERVGGAGGTFPTGRVDYLRLPPAEAGSSGDAAPPGDAPGYNAAVGVRPGDRVTAVRGLTLGAVRETGDLLRGLDFGRALRSLSLREEVTVVGIAEPPPLGGRPQAYGSIALAESLAPGDGLTEIGIDLQEGVDAEAWTEAHRPALIAAYGQTILVQTTERITSGVDQNLASNRVGFVLASILAFLAASFIILTGLTTGLAEQQRSLAMVRCIGGTRWQLGQAQLFTGAVIGLAGGVVGVPLGIVMAWALVSVFHERVPEGLAVPAWTLALSAAGAVVSGLIGALWPAWRAATLSPLEALASRARTTSGRAVRIVSACALAGLAVGAASVTLPPDGQWVFWSYAALGLPLMFIGYFLLGVPLVLLVARALGPLVSVVLRLPRRVLVRSVEATPTRHGLTAGATMTGLAMMVALWTNGGAFMRDWLGRVQFPDAFVSGIDLPPEALRRVAALPFVEGTCAVAMQAVEADAFGVRGLTSYKTSFVAFEPDPFFDMVNLDFVEGDEQTARRRLDEGGAVIVAREFRVAKGLGVGDTFTCRGPDGTEHAFEIVGVVTSPGLELVSKYFNIGEEFVDQALHAVFGSRADLSARFGSDAIQLIQIDLADSVSDTEAIERIRKELFGFGVLDAGSGRQIRAMLLDFVRGGLMVMTSVAIGAMIVASLGVANLVVAGIEARRYEFGVLRAVGGSRSLLARLVLGEALLVGITASIIGTLLGLQGAWAGRRLQEVLVGIELTGSVPWGAVAAGWAFVLALTLAAAVPAVVRLTRRPTRELIAGAA